MRKFFTIFVGAGFFLIYLLNLFDSIDSMNMLLDDPDLLYVRGMDLRQLKDEVVENLSMLVTTIFITFLVYLDKFCIIPRKYRVD